MKSIILSLIFSCYLFSSVSQTTIEWTPEYKLVLSDYASVATEINPELESSSIQSTASSDFAFQMASLEFMFTKNFNSHVKTVFNRNSAYIVASDSTIALKLLAFGQYTFDICELYSRKFRKGMFENKKVGSSAAFFRPIYDSLQAEMNERIALVSKKTDVGMREDLLIEEHQMVLTELQELNNYCRQCQLVKKKRKRNK